MNAQCSISQQLENVISPADVVPLMGQYVGPLDDGNGGWQIDFWKQHPHNKGHVQVICHIHVSVKRAGNNQLLSQPDILPHGAQNHYAAACRPNPKSNGVPIHLLGRFGFCNCRCLVRQILGCLLGNRRNCIPFVRDKGHRIRPFRCGGNLRFQPVKQRNRAGK